ncbi:MAG: lamin tail domain-containing protein [Balneolaceae bacterium]|nr:lamin tail domain-containing protein [Balneolaceae bacterium]
MFLKLRFGAYKKLLSLLPFLLLLPFLANSQSAQPGDIVITEFMADPDAVSDDDGEYVELYNRRSYSINIDGFTLSDDSNTSHLIDNGGTLEIPAESFIVLARSDSPGFTSDYVFGSGFSLTNSSDEIVLKNSAGIEIARLNYNSSEAGKSSELNDIQNVDANGEASASNYIAATNQLSNGDYGTPGNQGQASLAENPTVRILQSTFSVEENSGTGAITVIIEDPDGDAVEVDLVFDEENSQAEPEDFTSSSPVTISFPASASDGDMQTVYPPHNDSNFEGNEEAIFTLSNITTSGSATIANATSTTLTIEDDDQPDVVINEINADPGGDADGKWYS